MKLFTLKKILKLMNYSNFFYFINLKQIDKFINLFPININLLFLILLNLTEFYHISLPAEHQNHDLKSFSNYLSLYISILTYSTEFCFL